MPNTKAKEWDSNRKIKPLLICKFKNKPYLCIKICGIPILGEESEFLIFCVAKMIVGYSNKKR